MLRQLIRHPRTQALLAGLLGLYLRAVYRTTRWTLIGGEHITAALAAPEAAGNGGAQPPSVIFAFWHERLPLMALAWRLVRDSHPALDGRRAHVLVSRHRDGRLIGDVVGRFDVGVVHASSSRGGAAGLRGLLRLLGEGDCVVITPDGPRGPRRRAAPGVAQLAALSGRPVLTCAAGSSRVRRLGSWDRMLLPLPFGRGVVVVQPPLRVGRGEAEAALPAIEAALTAACERADAWPGAAAARGDADGDARVPA